MTNEEQHKMEPIAPIIDDAEKGTLTCPKCGAAGQRANRHCCMDCGYPFSDERQCPECGSLLTQTGLCEACGKTYRRAEHEREEEIRNLYSRMEKETPAPNKLLQYLNIKPAKILMIISVIVSFIVMILFFVPMIQENVTIEGYELYKGHSYKILEMLDLESAGVSALISMIFKGSAWSALWPPLAALIGLVGAIFMPISNLISLLKKNPMRRGQILSSAIGGPAYIILSVVVARAKLVPMFGKINAAGWVCIVLCTAVLALGIASYILLEKNCEEVKRCIPADKEKKYKKYSQKKLLAEMGIQA